MDIKERHVVLKEFGSREPQYDYLEANNEFYRNALSLRLQGVARPALHPGTALRLKLRRSSKTASSGWVLGCKTKGKGSRGLSRLQSSLRKSPVLVSERVGRWLQANASLLTLTLAEIRKLPSSGSAGAPRC
jgi:hypothetical protein